MNDVSASTRPAEAASGSRGAIGTGRAAAFAGIEIGWNAAGSMALGALGLREPARPGNATRARAAVSAALATNRVGRTIRARYDYSTERRASERAPRLSANEQEVSWRALDLAETRRRSRRGSGRVPRRRLPRAARPRPGGRRRSRSPRAPARPRAADSSRSIEPSNGSTTYRLSFPTDGSSGSATQTASRVPVSSQRTSQSVSGPSAIVVSLRVSACCARVRRDRRRARVRGLDVAPAPDHESTVLGLPRTVPSSARRERPRPSTRRSRRSGSTAGRQARPASGQRDRCVVAR